MKRHKRQFVVVGLGRFGRAIAQTLCEAGQEVLGVDRDADVIEDMRQTLTHVIQLDAMDREALEMLGCEDFDTAFVTMGSDVLASGTIVMQLKELGAKRVIAKAHDEFHGRMLEKLGADQVLFPERDMGRRIAHKLLRDNVVNMLEFSNEFTMAEIKPPEAWCGKPLKELALRKERGINVVAVRNGETVNAMPAADTVIQRGDVLLVIGSVQTLNGME